MELVDQTMSLRTRAAVAQIVAISIIDGLGVRVQENAIQSLNANMKNIEIRPDSYCWVELVDQTLSLRTRAAVAQIVAISIIDRLGVRVQENVLPSLLANMKNVKIRPESY